MRSIVIALCLLCLTNSSAVLAAEPAQQRAESADLKFKVNYLLYHPKGYGEDKTKKWPLVVFLHGSGERGSDLEKVKIHGPPKLIAKGQDFPFIVVSPQCPDDYRWSPPLLSGMLDEVIAKNKVDPDRIYLTGLSMGAFGTWDWAMAEPHRFAALVPICGEGEPRAAKLMKHIPVWIFHGAKDQGVPVAGSQVMFDALKKEGGNPKLTVYPDLEHDSWTVTYDNPELYKWLLEQKRSPVDQKQPKDAK
jgi:predicted peptidase